MSRPKVKINDEDDDDEDEEDDDEKDKDEDDEEEEGWSSRAERLQELSSDTDTRDERQALADAASILRTLKKEKLS
jgi:hypothetical protein